MLYPLFIDSYSKYKIDKKTIKLDSLP